MASKKIFSDQLEIALRVSGLNSMTKDEFVAEYEKTYGKLVTKTQFPNILQIIEKYSKYNANKDQSSEKKTPKKVSQKASTIDPGRKLNQALEETKSPYDQTSSEKKPKAVNQQELQQKAHQEIENKIHEANIIAMNRELKREEMAMSKSKSKVLHPYSKLMK
mmetsp:Transcript_33750/g.33242  ORF Transcript_33750/g.33242 Transcript_33750/m.33242 type:complete len:163 (-) Transcript_33750:379-867(-)